MTAFRPGDRAHLKHHARTRATTGTVVNAERFAGGHVFVRWDDNQAVTSHLPQHLELVGEPMALEITIPAPYVPFPGGRTQAHFMRTAAGKIKDSRVAGGSNVTAAVVKLLTDAADALEAAEQVQLDAEAYELSKAHGQGAGWAGFAFMAQATQEHWRRVARKARTLHGVTK